MDRGWNNLFPVTLKPVSRTSVALELTMNTRCTQSRERCPARSPCFHLYADVGRSQAHIWWYSSHVHLELENTKQAVVTLGRSTVAYNVHLGRFGLLRHDSLNTETFPLGLPLCPLILHDCTFASSEHCSPTSAHMWTPCTLRVPVMCSRMWWLRSQSLLLFSYFKQKTVKVKPDPFKKNIIMLSFQLDP